MEKYDLRISADHSFIHSYIHSESPWTISPRLGEFLLCLSNNTTTKIEVFTYIHTYKHACIHTYIHTYKHTCVHTYIHIYIHTHTHTHVYIIHIYIHTYIHKLDKLYTEVSHRCANCI